MPKPRLGIHSVEGPSGLPEFNVPFAEAAAFFGRKIPMTRADFDLLADWAKRRAFTVAGVAQMQVLNDYKAALQTAIDKGETLADFQKRARLIAAQNGWTGTTPWHTETIFRTNIQSAYGAGRYEQMRTVADEYPFWEYQAINDSRARPTHLKLDGTTLPADDPAWSTIYPPWGYNCRCTVMPLRADEVNPAFRKLPDDFMLAPEGDFVTPAKLGTEDEAAFLARIGGKLSPADLATVQGAVEAKTTSRKRNKKIDAEEGKPPDDPLAALSKQGWKGNGAKGLMFDRDGDGLEYQALNVRREQIDGVDYWAFSGRWLDEDLVKLGRSERWDLTEFQWAGTNSKVVRDSMVYGKWKAAPVRFGAARQKQLPGGGHIVTSDKTYTEMWGGKSLDDFWSGKESARYYGVTDLNDGMMAQRFVVRIPRTGKDAADWAALRDAVKGTPLEKILTAPTAADVERLQLMAAIVRRQPWATGPDLAAVNRIRAEKLGSQGMTLKPKAGLLMNHQLRGMSVDELRRYGKKMGYPMPTPQNTVKRIHGSVNFQTVEMDTLGTAQQADAYIVFHSTSADAATLAKMVKDDAALSTYELAFRGIRLPPTPNTPSANYTDSRTGGGGSIFARLLSRDHARSGAGPRHYYVTGNGDYGLVFDPKVTNRLDAYMYNRDTYGAIDPIHAALREDPHAYIAAQQRTVSGNEIMFRGGLSFEHLRYITATSSGAKAALIKQLRAEGITTLAGKPIEDMILVRPNKWRADEWGRIAVP